jgi:hypothetical protein
VIDESALQARHYLSALPIEVQSFRAVQDRHDANNVGKRLADGETALALVEQRLFNEGNAVVRSESNEDLLWPLPYEVPSQVAMHNDRKSLLAKVQGSDVIRLQRSWM